MARVSNLLLRKLGVDPVRGFGPNMELKAGHVDSGMLIRNVYNEGSH